MPGPSISAPDVIPTSSLLLGDAIAYPMMNATETLIDLRGARLDRRSDVSRGSAGQRRARDEGRTGDLGGEQAEGDARGSQPARASGFGIVIV